MAEMRDYKRRRQSYRAKNVHITKKSYTEVKKTVHFDIIWILSFQLHSSEHDFFFNL